MVLSFFLWNVNTNNDIYNIYRYNIILIIIFILILIKCYIFRPNTVSINFFPNINEKTFPKNKIVNNYYKVPLVI